MSLFVDTSALYALFDRDDKGHESCAAAWPRVLVSGRALVSSNYILVETVALLQKRLGLGAVHDLDHSITPLLSIRWVAEPLHRAAMDRLRRIDRRGISLVDCTSFLIMESEGIREAFAVDDDFGDAGFRLLPRR